MVFAESCTAGLVSAALAQIPGISEHHCGSAVVYRLDTKTRWLDVPAEWLLDPGPVSEIVAPQMATGVLSKTPEADWAAASPGISARILRQDGPVFIAVCCRNTAQPDGFLTRVQSYRLGEPHPEGMSLTDSLRWHHQVRARRGIDARNAPHRDVVTPAHESLGGYRQRRGTDWGEDRGDGGTTGSKTCESSAN